MSPKVKENKLTCSIDETILNKKTLPNMNDIALSFFASLCGKNRGAFVIDPPDGHTYGCLSFPEDFASLAGAKDDVSISNAGEIVQQYKGGNITAGDTLNMLNYLVESVYYSTPDKTKNIYGCEINGLAKLECDSTASKTLSEPIRSVTLAGLFTDALWATNGKSLNAEKAKTWYSLEDFQEMADIGLNTVQIPIAASVFVSNEMDLLEEVLSHVHKSGLQAILSLVGTGDEKEAIVSCAKYATRKEILGITLPQGMLIDRKELIASIRVEAPTLAIFLPLNEGDLSNLPIFADPNIYGALDLTHTSSIADIASSSSFEDRNKMFYHENLACIKRSPLEFSSCVASLPIFVSSGFDASVDDCFLHNHQNYGQCDRFHETIGSDWWATHRMSYIARQLYAYERGLGWSFATWKLYDSSTGILDKPAKLLSLKDIVAAGLFPNITYSDACLNPPVNDVALGDDTLQPTLSPPPDCGDGWWNYNTSQCDYWIPPTPAPTPACYSTSFTVEASVGGVVVGVLCTMFAYKFCFGRRGYTEIPH